MKNHRKHATLTRKKGGNYGANEVAFLGSNCENIYRLSTKLREKLSQKYKLGYIDASHKEEVEAPNLDTYTFHNSGDFQTHQIRDRIDIMIKSFFRVIIFYSSTEIILRQNIRF